MFLSVLLLHTIGTRNHPLQREKLLEQLRETVNIVTLTWLAGACLSPYSPRLVALPYDRGINTCMRAHKNSARSCLLPALLLLATWNRISLLNSSCYQKLWTPASYNMDLDMSKVIAPCFILFGVSWLNALSSTNHSCVAQRHGRFPTNRDRWSIPGGNVRYIVSSPSTSSSRFPNSNQKLHHLHTF